MHNNKYLIVIAGPTAVGKSHLALQLAQHHKLEIISADSRQIYRGLDIGTAKPSQVEQAIVKHHLIDIVHPSERYTTADFERDSLAILNQIFRSQQMALVCGGTGLYLHALMHGLDEIPAIPLEIQEHYQAMYQDQGLEPLQRLMLSKDPEYAKVIDLQNPHRIIRALSVFQYTGKSISSFFGSSNKTRFFRTIPILLEMDRQKLYERINLRVEQMIAQGLESEVFALREFANLQALQTVGYKEWFPYFAGDYDLFEVIRLIKRNTRRYAKRQLTWFRKGEYWKRFNPAEFEQIVAHVAGQMNLS